MTVEEWLGEDNQLGQDIWHKKYQKNGETFDEFLDRISLYVPEFREAIKAKKFIPGGRIMSNIGIPDNKMGMSNCYSRGFVEDDYGDIMQAAVDIGKTFKAQGGQGLSLSKLRPKGAPIGDRYTSDGIVPFMKIYNEVTEGTSQGGARKGALLISLDAWHAEVMNFITIKSKDGLIEKANLSLEIDDEFMECVREYYESGAVITVHKKQEYSGHVVEWDVTPIEVFKALVHNAYEWGDPGCIFVNRFRNYNLMEHCEEYQIETCNPCGEQPLCKHGACNLSSINLSEFVINPYTPEAYFDFEEFSETVKLGIRYLDIIVDRNANRHPLPEQRENSLNYRNCGLGALGYATMLMKLGMKYGSEEANEFTNKLFKIMFRSAVGASYQLAKEFGPFPKYDGKLFDSEIILKNIVPEDIEEYKKVGLRNCSLLSIAPNGSTATLLGESGGLEPEFAISYTRRTVGLTDNQDHYYKVYCKAAKEYLALHPETEGNLPDYFVSALEINPTDRVRTQSIIQKYIDTAISSTINLPEDTTEETVAQIYLYAWQQGLKGLTIFRNGCKRQGILTTGDESNSDNTKEVTETSPTPSTQLQRGDIINCSDDLVGKKRKIMSGCGPLHVLAYFDPFNGKLMEVYLNKGSQGGCANFMTGLSRTISLLCRAGVDVFTIKDQLDSTGSCPSYAVRSATKHDTSKGSCCPMAIGNALIDMWKEMQDEIDDVVDDATQAEDAGHEITRQSSEKAVSNATQDDFGGKCPECGGELMMTGGCILCKSCGWSRCD